MFQNFKDAAYQAWSSNRQIYVNTAYLVSNSTGGKRYFFLAAFMRAFSVAAKSVAIVLSGLMAKKYVEVSVECTDDSQDPSADPTCTVDVALLTDQAALYKLAGVYIAMLYLGQAANSIADNLMDRGLQLTTAGILTKYMDKVTKSTLIAHLGPDSDGFTFNDAQRVLGKPISELTKEMFNLHTSILELICLLAVLAETFDAKIAYSFLYVPVLAIVSLVMNRQISTSAQKMSDAYDEVAIHLTQNFDNIISIKAFKGEDEELGKLSARVVNMNIAKSDFLKSKGLAEFFRQFFFYVSLSVGGFFYVEGTTDKDEPISPNQLLSLINMLILLSGPLSKSSEAFEGISEAEYNVNKMLNFVRTPTVSYPSISVRKLSQGDRWSSAISLNFKNVCFSFPPREKNQAAKTVLNNINMTVSSGQSIAIVGGSGCGKSTIAKLMMGLYPVSSGDLTLNADNQEYSVSRDLMEKYGVMVFQNTDIFWKDINYNLGYPNHGSYSTSRLKEVIQEVKLSHLIMPPQAPLEAHILHPQKLSGGERQRVGIGRALLRNARLYIFDELTAGLDPVVAGQLIKDLNKLAKDNNAALVVITHNLETITMVDHVYFLQKANQGEAEARVGGFATVVEDGTYEKLSKDANSHLTQFLTAQKTSFSTAKQQNSLKA